MFQKCPICNGSGKAGNEFNSCKMCDVCNGKKIISSLSGKPPIDNEEIKKLQSFFEIPSSLGGNGNPFKSKPKSFKERLNEKIEEEEERIKELNNFK